nr:MAG TPA: hypothetical protein [Caudoviricetes sp.]
MKSFQLYRYVFYFVFSISNLVQNHFQRIDYLYTLLVRYYS